MANRIVGSEDNNPIDMHCHGVTASDFCKSSEIVLGEVESQLEREGICAVLTVFIPAGELAAVETLCRRYEIERRAGNLRRILGIATEGPLTANVGGTPQHCAWQPTKAEWRRLSNLGQSGLRYIVLSPDAHVAGGGNDRYPPTIEWILEALLDNGVKPALGHFQKNDPRRSAACVRRVHDYVERSGQGAIMTDHLFNDMPLNFKHAWRSTRQRLRRQEDLTAITSEQWRSDNLNEKVGFVPAALIHGALAGLSKLCLNFDGAHVDLEICRKTVELVGAKNLMLMTDRIHGRKLGGKSLRFEPENSLLYQEDGVVAGGTSPVSVQIDNMNKIGLSKEEIRFISHDTPIRLLSECNGCVPESRYSKESLIV